MRESRGFLQRKSDLRISGEVGMAAWVARAAARDDIAARTIGEIGRTFCRPLGNSRRNIRAGPRGQAAGDVQGFEETLGDGIGLAAGEPLREGNAVEALDRHNVGNTEAGEGIADDSPPG